MAIDHALLRAKVSHTRTSPKRNHFSYGVYYLCFALDELSKIAKLRLLSHNTFNLFSLRDRDYGETNGMPLEDWIRGQLSQWNIPQADGRIVLLTMPKLFGYGFNPVSFWFCLDKDNQVRAVLSEVSNTFGDRHSYICFHDDRRPITSDDWLESDKVFHVSPFMEIKGKYRFRFSYHADKVGVWIDYYDDNNTMLLTTSLTGKRTTLTSLALLACFFRYPLVTFKVIGLIHYQALKLWSKGIRYHTRQPLPPTEVSR